MLTKIASHEWRMLSGDWAPRLIVVILALSIVYGVLNGLHWVAFQQRTISEALKEETQRFAGLKQQIAEIEAGTRQAGFADPRSADAAGSRYGLRYAAMPPAPLAALSVGQSDVLPYYYKISTAAKDSVLSTNEIENPHRLLHGRFDLSFVIVYLFPLLILVASYNIISSEKEQGTLALLLSQPVSFAAFFASKLGLRASILILMVVVFALGALAIGGVSLFSSDSLVHVPTWMAIVAAYGAFWFAVVTFVCSFGRSSATNALALAGIWLVVVVILPSLLNLTATVLFPMPSRVALTEALRAASNEATAKGNELLARYYEDHPDLAAGVSPEKAMTDVTMTRLAVDAEIERKVRPVVESYDVQLMRQQKLVDRFRILSPAIIAQEALNDVAGTGAARHRHFMSLVNEFHGQWRSFFLPKVADKTKLSASTYDEIPRFQFREEPFAAMLGRTGFALAVLLIPAGAIGGLGLWRLKKFPIVG